MPASIPIGNPTNDERIAWVKVHVEEVMDYIEDSFGDLNPTWKARALTNLEHGVICVARGMPE